MAYVKTEDLVGAGVRPEEAANFVGKVDQAFELARGCDLDGAVGKLSELSEGIRIWEHLSSREQNGPRLDVLQDLERGAFRGVIEALQSSSCTIRLTGAPATAASLAALVQGE